LLHAVGPGREGGKAPTTQSEFNAFTSLLSSVGALNDPSNPLEWSRLKGVPGGIADGDDVGLTSVGWNDVSGRPVGLDDGDDVGLNSLAAGTGISISGSGNSRTIANTGDVNAGDDITSLTAGSGISIVGAGNSRTISLTPPEAAHIVGSFQSGWQNFGFSAEDVGYYADRDDVVHLQGVLQPVGASHPSNAFVLPVAYWPPNGRVFVAAAANIDAGAAVPVLAMVSITEFGVVIVNAPGASWVSLDGISFRR
jgi:hypothetical protein